MNESAFNCATVKVSGNESLDYPNVDGADISVNVTAKIIETGFYFDTSSSFWLNVTTNEGAQYSGETFNCNDTKWPDGCHYECKDKYSCYRSNLICESKGGCIVKCTAEEACSQMTLVVGEETGSPTAAPTPTPTAAPTGSPTKQPTGEPTQTPTYGSRRWDDFVYVDRDTVTDWDDTSIWDEKWYLISLTI